VSRAPSIHRSKAEHVAQQLLERIIDAKLKPGSTFATEAELLAQFSVSRPTMRESLKVLESQGVLELRQGPGGGIIVREPSIDLLAHGLSVFLRMHRVPFVSVIKAREVIEPALANEAAVNGSEEDFAQLEASIARIWCESLGRASVASDVSFLDYGGDSLNAMSILSRVREHLAADLDVREFFATPTVADQARLVAAVRASARARAPTTWNASASTTSAHTITGPDGISSAVDSVRPIA